ncbi:hypothetical protein LINGRAHAP2_LOCUS8390 [Linum grandiflorum]
MVAIENSILEDIKIEDMIDSFISNNTQRISLFK